METYPLPMRSGSAIVGFNTMEQLSRHHAIDFICFEPEKGGHELASIVSHVHLIPPQANSSAGSVARFLSRLLFWISPSRNLRGDRNLRSAISKLVSEGCYDAILLFELSAVKHFPKQLLHRLAVNIEDPQSIRISRMARLPVWSWRNRMKFMIVAELTRRYEAAILPRIGKVLLLSRKDMDDFRKQGNYSNLAYVPYGVTPKRAAEINPYENRKKVIVYTGNMFHPPNVDGALYFLNDIFPHVLRIDPSATFCIVGAEPDARIFQAAERYGSSVEITGRVANLASYLESAVVSVCPVRLEIGVQTKILESLSFGTPVVTTNAGNRGIGATSGMHLYAVDDVKDFAQKICELIRGRNWSALSENGLQFVTNNFSWKESARELEIHLSNLAGSGA